MGRKSRAAWPCARCKQGKRYAYSKKGTPYCLACWRQIQFEWGRTEKGRINLAKYRREHADETRKRMVDYRCLHPEKDRDYYQANKERIKAQTAEYQRKHPEQRVEYQRRDRAKRLDHVRTLVRNRRARVRGAVGAHTDQDIKRLLWFQDGLCQYCLKKMERYTVDHMIPLIRGGSNEPSNLCMACLSCNSRKSFRTADEFFQLLESA